MSKELCEKNAAQENTDKTKEQDIENAFLNNEKKEIQKERNDQLRTKRLIDSMMLAPPQNLNNEVCNLLSNFKGIIYIF